MRRTADEALRTRSSIVGAAHDLFTTKGFADTSTAEVVDAAGVTRGALYHHFADKTALFLAVFVQHRARGERDRHGRGAGRPACPRRVLPWLRGAARLHRPRPTTTRSSSWTDPPCSAPRRGTASIRPSAWPAMEAGLQALEQAGVPAPVPQLAGAGRRCAFGALTEAGIVLSRGAPGSPSRDELVRGFLRLLTVAVRHSARHRRVERA